MCNRSISIFIRRGRFDIHHIIILSMTDNDGLHMTFKIWIWIISKLISKDKRREVRRQKGTDIE